MTTEDFVDEKLDAAEALLTRLLELGRQARAGDLAALSQLTDAVTAADPELAKDALLAAVALLTRSAQ